MAWNCDGVPLAESSSATFHPILGQCDDYYVFIIALYHGFKKPNDFNIFLSDFVKESRTLIQNGIFIRGIHYSFKIYFSTNDTPAKADILCIKHPAGYFSCPRCKVVGRKLEVVSMKGNKKNIHFLGMTAVKRTDAEYRVVIEPVQRPVNKKERMKTHHLGRTVLTDIPGFNVVKDVVVDIMHIYYNIIKGLIAKYIGSYGRIKQEDRPIVAMWCNELNRPQEFARKPRNFFDFLSWKATELRQFILYTGVVVLRGYLPEAE